LIVNLAKKVVIGHFNFRSKVDCLKISKDGKFVAVACNKSLRIFEMPRLIKEFEPLVLYKNYTHWQNDEITSINWSNDSRFVLTASKDTTVRLLNLFKIDGYVPLCLSGHKRKIVNALFSEDNLRIYSISKEGVLFVWKYVEERSEAYVKRTQFERSIRSGSNLKSINEMVNGDDDQSDDEVDEFFTDYEKKMQSGRFILEKKQQFQINGKIATCEINTSANILVFGLHNGIFSIFDLNTFESKYTLQITDNKINTMAISNSGLWLAFGSTKQGQLLVWEWKSETYVFKQQGHNYDVSAIAYSPDSSQIASGGQDGKIKVWDTVNTACIVTFAEHTSKITDLKYAPSKANVLVSSSLDGTVRAYDLIKYRNFRIMTSPKPCQFLALGVDFSGEIVCAGSMDPYSIFVWSLKTGDLVDVLTGHTGPVCSLAFSTVKDILVSGSWDKTVKIWELYSKKGNSETLEHTSEIVSVDLTPDDKSIAVCTLNGELYTWDLETANIVSKFVNINV
jgi:periodic tryptophan protein 2